MDSIKIVQVDWKATITAKKILKAIRALTRMSAINPDALPSSSSSLAAGFLAAPPLAGTGFFLAAPSS